MWNRPVIAMLAMNAAQPAIASGDLSAPRAPLVVVMLGTTGCTRGGQVHLLHRFDRGTGRGPIQGVHDEG